MKLLDYTSVVFVLETEPGSATLLCAQLQARRAEPQCIKLSNRETWRDTMRQRLLHSSVTAGHLDALVLAPRPVDDERFWRTQDGLIEALETAHCPVAVLAHDDGLKAVQSDEPQRLLLTHGVPSEPTAVAFDSRVLYDLLDVMPTWGAAGALTPSDWLTMAVWMSRAVTGTTRCALTWPPFMRHHALVGPAVLTQRLAS